MKTPRYRPGSHRYGRNGLLVQELVIEPALCLTPDQLLDCYLSARAELDDYAAQGYPIWGTRTIVATVLACGLAECHGRTAMRLAAWCRFKLRYFASSAHTAEAWTDRSCWSRGPDGAAMFSDVVTERRPSAVAAAHWTYPGKFPVWP